MDSISPSLKPHLHLSSYPIKYVQNWTLFNNLPTYAITLAGGSESGRWLKKKLEEFPERLRKTIYLSSFRSFYFYLAIRR